MIRAWRRRGTRAWECVAVEPGGRAGFWTHIKGGQVRRLGRIGVVSGSRHDPPRLLIDHLTCTKYLAKEQKKGRRK